MRKIEKEEVQLKIAHVKLFMKHYVQEQVSYQDPDKKQFHLCIVNLVIGYADTLHYNYIMCYDIIALCTVLKATMSLEYPE